jgi:hypothetical protein
VDVAHASFVADAHDVHPVADLLLAQLAGHSAGDADAGFQTLALPDSVYGDCLKEKGRKCRESCHPTSPGDNKW